MSYVQDSTAPVAKERKQSMPSASKSVAPLDKVTLRIQVDPENKHTPPPSPGEEVSFICGIGSSGMAPFEQMLYGKGVGDRFSLPMEPGAGEVIFGHLNCMFSQAVGFTAPCQLDITIESVTVAEGHEIVKALAQTSEGCGGDCGCGCGG
jgi:hypothetical protein